MSDYYAIREELLPLWASARRTDPPTSKAAGLASRSFAAGHGRKILHALADGPGTKDQLAERCELDEQQVARRMRELVRGGLVRVVGEAVSPSGNREQVYAACAATCERMK